MRIHRGIDEADWWEVASRCHYATFFHSPLWSRLVLATYPEYRDASIWAMLRDGTRAVFPVIETGRSGGGLFRNLCSTFAGCYGGPIADVPLSCDDERGLYRALLSWDTIRVTVTGNPFGPTAETMSGYEKREDSTHIISLSEGFDAVQAGFSRGHRTSALQGRRRGVTTRVATSIEDYRFYFDAYTDSLRRWGDNTTSIYPWLLFENGFRLSQAYPGNMKLWVAELDGQIISGVWMFYWNHHAVAWHAASHAEYFEYRPANVLFWDIMEDACQRGYDYFDFNPSGGHEGVAEFKRRFGTETVCVPRQCHTGVMAQVAALVN
jgi:hypothetical protein